MDFYLLPDAWQAITIDLPCRVHLNVITHYYNTSTKYKVENERINTTYDPTLEVLGFLAFVALAILFYSLIHFLK